MNKKLIIGVFLIIGFNCSFLSGSGTESSKIIYLCGEYHNHDDHSRFKVSLLKSACERRLVFAAEGLERDNLVEKEISEKLKKDLRVSGQEGEAYIYGVEDSLFSLFKGPLDLNSYLRSMKKRQKKPDFSIKKKEILYPLVRKSSQEFLADFWASESLIGNPIFDYLKMNKDALLKKTPLSQTTTFDRRIQGWTDDDWINFTHDMTLIIAPMISKQLHAEKLETLAFVLSCLNEFELEDNCDAEAKSDFFLDRLHLDLRDDFIVNNLEEIYSITEKKKKAVVCILGYAHIEGVKAGLEKKGFVVLGKEDFLEAQRRNEL